MKKYALVSAITAALYDTPQQNTPIIDEVLQGMIVIVLEEKGKWAKIETQYHYVGYIPKSTLKLIGTFEKTPKNSFKTMVCAAFADVLSAPDIKSTVIDTLFRGCTVRKTGNKEKGYAEVRLANGKGGFVKSDFLGREVDYGRNIHIFDESTFRKDVVATATSYLGAPYRWGGKTPLGIDCSGLCSISYLLNGITIFRDAKIDANFPVREIPLEEAKKGDLLYFKGHMGIYVDNGAFIHSSVTNCGVAFNSLNFDNPLFRKDLEHDFICAGSIF